MRKMLQIPLAAIVILVAACGHQSEISDFGSQLYRATSEMTDTIDSDPSAHGVKAAYTNFMKTQDQLHGQWNKLLLKRLTKDDQSSLDDAVMRSREKLVECFSKHTGEFHDKTDFWEAFGLLRSNFESQFKVEDVH